ncbi:uncharacterized protein PFL1_05519 [Pseudozyma flocculosa PF-1]|uniref:Alkyl hydroperoxide reductase subunit C/ Thiol specific antioxidant domain-containing protein n=2 Tax=Pseudozyma flocculosa TaxID=84751 RepID=A0A5C3FAG1_9BASI|nr:uncharacterized protein PFL1_05519 [Pseudozyma flocculosa PF-1]EPQ26884.1 hypothetical protein PFL1_05519 [Pseudozyma flocculosa PF-1]SPO41210.1 uncharacterized protein PSFLO_06692 [Pseudozyma flocculosa]
MTQTEDRSAFHLLGHPLPAIIDLDSTAGGTVDLFILSLSKPVLLFLYPQSTSSAALLASYAQHLPPLRRIEPDLHIFGLSTQPHAEQLHDVAKHDIPFPLLSDEHRQLTQALDIPTVPAQGSTSVFKHLTLLLNGGQITRIDFPIDRPEEAAVRALRLLVSEEELMRQVEERDAKAAAAAAAATAQA